VQIAPCYNHRHAISYERPAYLRAERAVATENDDPLHAALPPAAKRRPAVAAAY
jgi:hypothetical protein